MKIKNFSLKKNRTQALNLLRATVEVLNDVGIRYYLDFGTLLGAVREGELIPWDDDIDISLLDEDDYYKIPMVLKKIKKTYMLRTYLFTFKKSRERRVSRGRTIHTPHIWFTHEDNYQIAKIRNNKFFIFGRGGATLDIFFKYTHGDETFWLAYGKTNKMPNQVMPKELIEIDFCGIKCTIPKNYEEYLTVKYGDWKTPNPDWCHDRDDLSAIYKQKEQNCLE